MRLNKTILANKILNELRYNKRLVPIVIVPIKIIINGTEYKDAHMQLIPKIYPSPQEYDIVS